MKKNNTIKESVHLVIPPSTRKQLASFLRNKSKDGCEAYACMLCGQHHHDGCLRLLSKYLILPDDDCFIRRTGGGIKLRPDFDGFFLGKAETEGLIPVQIHTHPHKGQPVFSPVDDQCESERAKALRQELGFDMASCVFDKNAESWQARYWTSDKNGVLHPEPMLVTTYPADLYHYEDVDDDPRFDRQVRAFGRSFQARLDKIKVGILGLGGTGSIMTEGLARLGVRHFVLVDPDVVEMSNLNRLVGATKNDAMKKEKKVKVACRNIRKMHGRLTRVEMIARALPDNDAAKALASCDILVAATDNHSSRLYLQEIGSAFLRPVINIGVGFVVRQRTISHISGRTGASIPGEDWCLYCGGHINPELAAKELADKEHLNAMKKRGYIKDTPNPAVYWVNMQVISHALSLFHQLVMSFSHRTDGQGDDVFIDLLNGEQLYISHGEREKDCLICSPEGLYAIGDGYFDGDSISDIELLSLDLIG